MVQIKDGAGGGAQAKVDPENRLRSLAHTQDIGSHSNDEGNAYNINSGVATLSITSANEAGVLYFKNGEDLAFRITGIVAISGPSTGGTLTRFRVYKNPTGGTLITDANTTGVINSNRNFGSSNTLANSLVYNAAATDESVSGSVHIASSLVPPFRNLFAIDEVLNTGDSIAITFETLANSAMEASAAIIGYQVKADDQ